MTKMLRQTAWAQALILSALVPGLVLWPMPVHSNPSGAAVAHGVVEIDDTIPGHLKIMQGTDKAIINWQDFSIGAGELTEFLQPGAGSVALNRVISGNPSSIFGTLRANGGVILVNQNGILVGGGGVIDVGGLMALSTLDIDDSDFLNGGTMTFKGNSAAGVTNLGTITSRGGDVVLLGNFVDNQGAVGAPDGTVAFGAGGEFIVDTVGESRLSVIAGGPGGETGISNSGSVSAAAVEFKAHGNVYALAIQNTGIVRANGVSRRDGRIILSAAGDGTVGGRIENTGTLRARRGTAGGEILIDAGPGGQVDILGGRVDANGDDGSDGGSITMLGDVVNVGGDSRVTANGANGGTIQIGSQSGTSAVTIGPDAAVTANGDTGAGGVVQVLGNASSVINVFGQVSADGAQSGGLVRMSGGTVTTHEGSLVSANGGDTGGQVQFVGNGINSVNVNGTVSATGGTGGRVTIGAEQITTGANSVIDTSGEAVGGLVLIDGNSAVNVNGAVSANGVTGDGGRVMINGAQGVNVGETARLEADGLSGDGGDISVKSGTTTEFGGEASAIGGSGNGGTIDVTGDEVLVLGSASLDASGSLGGGEINIGGGFQGGLSRLRNSTYTEVADGAQFVAQSYDSGDAGQVVIWSDENTVFSGSVDVRALGASGDGGMIEVSGKNDLSVGLGSSFAASAVGGKSGGVLFDPGDLVLGDVGASDISYETINNTLQNGVNVTVATQDGSIRFNDLGLGNNRHGAIQWTDSRASFGAFAGKNITVLSNIRTSGMGSVSLLAGWTGLESDAQILANDPEAAWNHYVENGQFGNLGSVFLGDPTSIRYISVGSRFGNTNVAATTLNMLTPDLDGGESDYVHLGFRDSGQIFTVRGAGGFGNTVLDLNDRALEAENDVIVGIFDEQYFRDVNGDGIPDGVYAINSTGVLDENNTATGASAPGAGDGNATLITFANHFMSERQGNYWWQQIAAKWAQDNAGDPYQEVLGALAPENGAGGRDITGAVDLTQRADINVLTTASVTMQGGGRHQNYVQIGHGGNASAWGDDRGLRDGNSSNNINGQIGRNYIFNGAQQNRSGTAIARLAPVYGNINVLAGVNRNAAIDVDNVAGTVTATTSSLAGLIRMEGWQDTASANAPDNPNSGNNSESNVQIGHLGTGQFGSAFGDILVQAGGDISLVAGAHSRNSASIGHTLNGYAYWNPVANEKQQVRFFANAGDLDNPNLRRGELFSDGAGGVGRGVYTPGFRGGRWDDDFVGAPSSTGTLGSSPGGPVQIEAQGGIVRTELVGDITVRSGGPNGVLVQAYSTPDTRTGTAAEGDPDGITSRRDRRFAGIGHGGVTFGVWAENDDERVRLSVVNGNETNSGTQEFISGGTQINRNLTYVTLIGDIEVEAINGGVQVIGGNNTYDYARIGHGGDEVADYETSGIMAGDIYVHGLRDLTVIGGGSTPFTGNNNDNLRAHAIVGHGGYRNGFTYFGGDIMVDMGGDVTVTAGAYEHSFGKIGHQGSDAWGQTGGSFSRVETFDRDSYQPTVNLAWDVTDNVASVTIDGETHAYTFGQLLGDSSESSADIEVNADGDITLNHLGAGDRLPWNVAQLDTDKGTGVEIDYAFAQIGHGGRNVDPLRYQNDAYNYDDKVGDVTVSAGGDLTMENGSGIQHWTAIGHRGSDGADRIGAADGEMIFAGDINVMVGGNLIMDALAAGTDNGNLMIPTNDNATLLTATGEMDAALLAALTGPGVYQVSSAATGDVIAGTVSIVTSENGVPRTIIDDGNGVLLDASDNTPVGTIDYATGDITFAAAVGTDTVVAGEADPNLNTAAISGTGNYTLMATGGDVQFNSVVITVVAGGGGTTTFTDDGAGVIQDGGMTPVGTIDYATGLITFTSSVAAGGDTITVDYNKDALASVDYQIRRDQSLGTDNATESFTVVDNGRVNERSPVVIGHGAVEDAYGLVTLGTGATVAGLQRNSDINVTVGNDMTMRAGNGIRAQYVQVGHGFGSDVGNDLARFNNVPTGFSGDINVSVGNDLSLIASSAGSLAGRRDSEPVYSTEGGAAVIGHGGHQFEAPMNGDITVYVGNNLSMLGGVRDDSVGIGAAGLDHNGNVAAGRFHIAKIGHWTTEMDLIPQVDGRTSALPNLNDGRARAGGGNLPDHRYDQGYINIGGRGPVGNGTDKTHSTGDITVVVGNDLTMTGGSTTDPENAPVQFNYAQIGHGGPGAEGDKSGDITVIAQGDIAISEGSAGIDPNTLNDGTNNYAMVGHGDWMRNGTGNVVPGAGAPGDRGGNIVVAAGDNASFSGALVGHADPEVLPGITTIDGGSNTFVAASRNYPFQTGTGTLSATNGSIFSSGFYGFDGDLRFYIPKRSNNLVDTTTRLNEVINTVSPQTYVGTPADFAAPFDASLGAFAGREDEVYLQPDLWWDNAGISTALGSMPFPTDALSGQGGAVATVADPGDFPNLVSLSAGILGDGTAVFRGANGVSGTGNYTFYYDAIQNVTPIATGGGFPVIVEVPEVEEPIIDLPVFDYFPFLFVDKFDSYDRDDLWFEGEFLFGLFSIFGLPENAEYEASQDDNIRVEGDEILEESPGLFGLGPARDESEEDEEENKSARYLNMQNTMYGQFWIYDINTNEYSSFKVFGIPQVETLR